MKTGFARVNFNENSETSTYFVKSYLIIAFYIINIIIAFIAVKFIFILEDSHYFYYLQKLY